MILTPKAKELLLAIKKDKKYLMSCMGDLIFKDCGHHSRQTIALKAGRFARQLLDAKYIARDGNGYKITHAGMLAKSNITL